MSQLLQPWQLLVAVIAGWINEHQQAAIEYLREENRVLKEQLGGKRLRLTDDQRRRLASKGKKLGRRAFKDLGETLDGQPFEGSDSIVTVGCRRAERPLPWMRDDRRVVEPRGEAMIDLERK